MYMGGAVALFYIAQWSVDWIWGYFGTPPSELYVTVFAGLLSIFVAVYTYRNERIHGLANEVAAELKKVSWPSAKEIRAATIVVIVMSILSAIILYAFDFMWSNLTEIIYGG
jgi:preprotein translocase subunit SecE